MGDETEIKNEIETANDVNTNNEDTTEVKGNELVVQSTTNYSEEEIEFRKKLDHNKKIEIVQAVAKFQDGAHILFRIDKALLKHNSNEDQFCTAIKGAMDFKKIDLIKKYALEYISRDFDEEIVDLIITPHGNLHEKDTCVVMKLNGEQVIHIKFLRRKLTDDDWKVFRESIAGKDSVIIKNEAK